MENEIKATAELIDAGARPENLPPETIKLIVGKNELIKELQGKINKMRRELIIRNGSGEKQRWQ